jgi:hypothetical protein
MILFTGTLALAMGFTKDVAYEMPVTEPTCKSELTRGLIAYYPFTGNFNDASGNGNHATPKNGAQLTSDCNGDNYKAAGFDGHDDYVIVHGNKKLNTDSLSISFQVMVHNSDRRNVTISRINFETGQSLIYGIHESMPDDNAWNFGMTSNTDDCSVSYGYDPGLACYSKRPITPGRWHSIIVTFGKGFQKMYVDGVLQATRKRNFQTAKKCANADLMIGGWWKQDIVSIDGKIDEVRLYNRVINECEIAKLASQVVQTSEPARRLHRRI